MKEDNQTVSQRIKQNELLRKKIVDAADYYDGRETQIIGKAMLKILRECDIHDIPECYSQKYFDKVMKRLTERRERS